MNRANKASAALVLGCCALAVTGCDRAAFDSYACYKVVEASYPQSEVVRDFSDKYVFYVRKPDGSVWRVKTTSLTSTEITEKQELLPAAPTCAQPEEAPDAD